MQPGTVTFSLSFIQLSKVISLLRYPWRQNLIKSSRGWMPLLFQLSPSFLYGLFKVERPRIGNIIYFVANWPAGIVIGWSDFGGFSCFSSKVLRIMHSIKLIINFQMLFRIGTKSITRTITRVWIENKTEEGIL